VDGVDAVEKFKNFGEKVVFIIMDIRMPRMDGILATKVKLFHLPSRSLFPHPLLWLPPLSSPHPSPPSFLTLLLLSSCSSLSLPLPLLPHLLLPLFINFTDDS
jgi:hypothetical protein